jgi:AcrR family transcriptional regulator
MTAQQIIDTAITLFAKKGYNGVSVDELAKASGVNKATIYYHYKGKKEVFEEVLKYKFDKLLESLEEGISKVDEPTLKLKAFIEVMSDRKYELVVLMNREILDGAKNISQNITDIMCKIFDLLEDILTFGVEEKEFKKVNTDIIKDMILGATNFHIITYDLKKEFVEKNSDKGVSISSKEEFKNYLFEMIIKILKD